MFSKMFLFFATLLVLSGIRETSALPVSKALLLGTAIPLATGATPNNDQAAIIKNSFVKHDSETYSKLTNHENSVQYYLQDVLGVLDKTSKIDMADDSLSMYTNNDWNNVSSYEKKETNNSDKSNLQNEEKNSNDEKTINQAAKSDDADLNLSAWYIAVKNGNLDTVKNFIPADLNEKDHDGLTALHWATKQGNAAVAENLIAMGANVNVQDKNGSTSLHRAVIDGNKDIAKLIIDSWYVNLNVKDQNGLTALHLAAQNGEMDIAKRLIYTWSVNLNVQDENGCTPLHSAIISGNTDIAKLFINKFYANLNLQDNRGRTVLHWATEENFVDIVKLLLKARVNERIMDNDHKYAIQLVNTNTWEMNEVYAENTERREREKRRQEEDLLLFRIREMNRGIRN